jgi:hypothetical protein
MRRRASTYAQQQRHLGTLHAGSLPANRSRDGRTGGASLVSGIRRVKDVFELRAEHRIEEVEDQKSVAVIDNLLNWELATHNPVHKRTPLSGSHSPGGAPDSPVRARECALLLASPRALPRHRPPPTAPRCAASPPSSPCWQSSPSRPTRGVLPTVLHHHTHRSLSQLLWVPVGPCHRSILSRNRASRKPGAVQTCSASRSISSRCVAAACNHCAQSASDHGAPRGETSSGLLVATVLRPLRRRWRPRQGRGAPPV